MVNVKESKKSKNTTHEKENAPSRKRKASGSLPGHPASKQKESWFMDSENYMYKELGVGPLTDNSQDSNSNGCPLKTSVEKTPAILISDSCQVPDAPCVMATSHLVNNSDSSSPQNPRILKSLPQRDDDFIRRRKKVLCRSGSSLAEMLPDLVLLNIFKYLPKVVLTKCAQVCKKWQRIMESECLWKRLDLGNKTLTEGVLGQILNRGVVVLRLTRAEISSPIYTGPTSVFSSTKLSKLQYLDLSIANISVKGLGEILAKCHDLRKLSLESCDVDDAVCSYIGENKQLEVLNMCMTRGITDNGLMPIASNCRKLESLNLAWTGLEQHSLMYLSLCLPESLLKLNISGFRENLTDEEVTQLVTTCPNLITVDLSDSSLLTENSVNAIVGLKNLEHLSLTRCNRILPVSLYSLSNLPQLSVLNIYGMLPDGILQHLSDALGKVAINKCPFTKISRPTTGIHRTSIWGLRVRDNPL
uniref:F-box domain-containing protein n=2 Tax=Octopus bimaculoides TaxID=37653 RepID=A0A0L8II10_OCTBM